MKRISRADFFNVIESQSLWKELSHAVSFYYHVLLWKSYHFFAADSYMLVRKSLITLSAIPLDHRMNINASQYITSTTNLSKKLRDEGDSGVTQRRVYRHPARPSDLHR